ncbi:uncharacterized protein VTP21DRAFT_6699 [Calcarisporiella thermophila]|uniref:uncharacterized protein n=1 Tax=Calcarisporiella thermophila TaxID=911321 RepID=UPI0037441D5D
MNINAILDSFKNEQDDYLDHLYDVLEVAPSSTFDQIAAEYKVKALATHPDKQGHLSPDERLKLQRKFEQITVAYRILHDQEERAAYDKWRQSGLRIPYAVWRRLGSHAQSVHWQSLPAQSAITNFSHSDHQPTVPSVTGDKPSSEASIKSYSSDESTSPAPAAPVNTNTTSFARPAPTVATQHFATGRGGDEAHQTYETGKTAWIFEGSHEDLYRKFKNYEI